MKTMLAGCADSSAGCCVGRHRGAVPREPGALFFFFACGRFQWKDQRTSLHGMVVSAEHVLVQDGYGAGYSPVCDIPCGHALIRQVAPKRGRHIAIRDLQSLAACS